jgi:hypothetical protein
MEVSGGMVNPASYRVARFNILPHALLHKTNSEADPAQILSGFRKNVNGAFSFSVYPNIIIAKRGFFFFIFA